MLFRIILHENSLYANNYLDASTRHELQPTTEAFSGAPETTTKLITKE